MSIENEMSVDIVKHLVYLQARSIICNLRSIRLKLAYSMARQE